MPKYKWDIKDLIFEEDAKKMFHATDSLLRRAFISMCWLTGARTSEMMMLKKEDIGFDKDYLEIRLHTLKLGTGDYKTDMRTLKFTRPTGMDTNIYVETIIRHASSLPGDDERLFPYTSRWAEARVIGPLSTKVLGKWLTPYHFRHSCMQWLAKSGAGLVQLMHFKGAKSPMSVQPYISAVPTLLKIENLNRGRALTQEPDKPLETKVV